MHVAVETIPPALLICSRYLLGGTILLVVALLRGERLGSFSALKREMGLGFLVLFAGNALVYWALQEIPTGLAAIVVAMTPFWMITLAACIPPRERISPAAIVGLVIGFLGICVLFGPKWLAHETPTAHYWFYVLGLMTMNVFWSLGSILARKTPTQVPVVMGVGIQNLTAAILTVPLCFITMDWSTVHPSAGSVACLFYLAVFGTAIALPCYFYVLKVLPLPITSSITYVTPVITLILGALLLKETVTGLMILGTGIILSGVLWLQWNQFRSFGQISAMAARTVPSKAPPVSDRLPILETVCTD